MIGFGKKLKAEDRGVNIGHTQGAARKCAVCCEPAIYVAYRKNAQGYVDESSRRYCCEDHTTPGQLFPVRLSGGKNVPTFGSKEYFSREEDMFNFYREIIQKAGGVLEPIHAEAKSQPKWKKLFALEPLPAPKLVKEYHRTFRRARGLTSGRQWIKFRKAEGLHRTAR